MPWIESHAALARHPKTRALMRGLDINKREAIGLLQMLWWWALDYAPEGELGTYDARDVADAVEWDGEAPALIEALVGAHWLDRTDSGLVIHDWEEYAGRLIERRDRNAERMRVVRATRSSPKSSTSSSAVHGTSGARPEHTQQEENARAALPDRTGPDQTGPDRNQPAAAGARAEALIEEFYEAIGVEPHGLTRSIRKRELAIASQLVDAGAPPGEARRFVEWCRAGPYRPVPSDLRVYESKRAQFLAGLEPVAAGPPARHNGVDPEQRMSFPTGFQP